MKHRLSIALCLALATSWGASAQTGKCPGAGNHPELCPPGEPLVSDSFHAKALIDFVAGDTYMGLQGGLYGNNSNVVPVRHDQDGKNFAAAIQPIDGKIVFLSVGLSNTSIEFCGGSIFNYGDPNQPCATTCPNPRPNTEAGQQSFMAQAHASGVVNPAVIVWDGALGGQAFNDWDPYVDGTIHCTNPPTNLCKHCPNDPTNPWCNYDRVQSDLAGAGLTESQVQAIWLKGANGYPQCSLGGLHCPAGYVGPTDAILAEQYMGDILRAIHVRYPNARLVFVSPRIYGGYANECLNPEPFAYEYGFSIQKLVLAQVKQINGGGIDGNAGNLNYDAGNPPVTSPWVGWGPYLWASGTTANGEGLFWCDGRASSPCFGEQDFRAGSAADPGDFTHPSSMAEQKVGAKLLDFMKTSPYTKPWFCSPGSCP
jgi:hypothetical protein